MKAMLVSSAKLMYRMTPSAMIRRAYFRAFCALVRGRKVETAIDGIRYGLDLGETIDIGIFLGGFEQDVCAAIDRMCRPGDTVLDIGANIGAHTLRFARNVGSGGVVYAFEPTDYAYGKLLRNIALNDFGNITPQKVALSDARRTDVCASIKSRWPTNGIPVEETSRFDCIRLDDWLQENGVTRIDLIKLDVDGNEYGVLVGGSAALAQHRPAILMEAWGPNFADDSRNPFTVLEDLGYHFFDLTTGSRYGVGDLRRKVSVDGRLIDHSINIIARHGQAVPSCR